MAQHGDHPESRDPREVLFEVPAPGPAAGDPGAAAHVEELIEEIETWLRRRIRRRARAVGIEPDDLHQEVRLSLLRGCTKVEPTNPGVRSWLGRRVEWVVVEMLRRRGAERPVAPEVLQAAQHELREPGPSPEESADFTPIDVPRLMRMGLNRHQAEAIAMRCHGNDLPLKDFAQLVSRTPAAVRQDLHRGLARIESLFELSTLEGDVVRAWRRYGAATSAAPYLRLSVPEFTRILEDAHKKIDRIFNEREGRP